MDLSLDLEELAFRDRLRGFLAQHRPPAGKSFEDGLAWQRTLNRGQWVAPHWPTEHGGQGATLMQYALFITELSALDAPQFANRIAVSMVGPTILAHGTDEQRTRYLPPILSGAEIWCQLFSEPNAGSDLSSVSTRAIRDGDEWVVTGQKVWSSFAAEAHFGVVLARTAPDSRGSRGLSYLIIDMRSPGVEVRPIRQLTGDCEFSEVFLAEVRTPHDHMVGPEGDGWSVMQTNLANERGISFPLKEQALLTKRVTSLIDEASGGRIDVDVALRRRLVDDWIRTRVFSLMNLQTLTRMSQGFDPGARASITKLLFSDLAQHVQETAAKLAGPAAVAGNPEDWYDLLWYRSASIAGGTSEIQRDIIARRLLRLPVR